MQEANLMEQQVIEYRQTENLVDDARTIIESSQRWAHRAVNVALVYRNWFLGKRIAEEELKGEDRAEYGAEVIKSLAKKLTKEYGKGFSKLNLWYFLRFYKAFPKIIYTASRQSDLLSWSHYRTLLRVEDDTARNWYAHEAATQGWSVRTLDRNIATQYYHRLLMTHAKHRESVEQEMKEKTAEYQADKLEFVKDPVVAEFLGLRQDPHLHETTLEGAIIANLQDFMLEMGKGYAFVARQQHIKTDLDDFYIDLVFYNIILKCYVLIDLKIGKITHQDVGQMDMYVRMYDDLKRIEGDNPTLGIVLCSETSETIARYSVLNGSEQLFATKYKLYLPSEEQLRDEIETQKRIFLAQQTEQGDEEAK